MPSLIHCEKKITEAKHSELLLWLRQMRRKSFNFNVAHCKGEKTRHVPSAGTHSSQEFCAKNHKEVQIDSVCAVFFSIIQFLQFLQQQNHLPVNHFVV